MDAGNDKDGALGVELYDAEFGEDDGLGGNFSNNYTVDKLLEMYLGPKQVCYGRRLDGFLGPPLNDRTIIPSVGVKEGLSCVFSRTKWPGKARNLALP